MQNYNDTSARLLAQENISIVRAPVGTASFDAKNRVLSIPQWKDMTPQIEDMLLCHEVGHALYTDPDEWMSAIAHFSTVHPDAAGILRGYLNVIEDARIESRIKEEYPGIAKSFYTGYRTLNDRDFFSIKNRDINDFALIDKINLYFKIGFLHTIKFGDAERVYLRKVDSIKSIADGAKLAIEIYEFSLQQVSSQDDILDSDESQQCDDDNDLDAIDDGDDGDCADEYEYDNTTTGTTAKSDLRATTSETLDKKLGELADTSIQFKYYGIRQLHYDPLIDYKTVLADTAVVESKYTQEYINKSKRIFTDFHRDATRSVDYLIKEFEMKKSADSFARQLFQNQDQLILIKYLSTNLPRIFSVESQLFHMVRNTV